MEHTLQKVVQVSGGSWVTVDVYGEQDGSALVIIPGVMSDAHGWRQVAENIEDGPRSPWSTAGDGSPPVR